MFEKVWDWFVLKVKLEEKKHIPPKVKERDIWWMSLGKNVGSEINGKNELFSRPGLIIKKLSKSTYLIAPTTTKQKIGSWYVPISYCNKDMNVCLHQIRVVDYRRLSSKLDQLTQDDFNRVRNSFLNLYK
jgi:mRNA-degrading endonuclease toxin of MazEF toxin-antitoxin module